MTQSSPTTALYEAGQSPWLDNLSRELIRSGKLKQLIQQGVLGVTSNPSIFQKAIAGLEGGYAPAIQKMLRRGKGTLEIYDALTIEDIRQTCDLFLPVYKKTRGEHGFVSLEVLPGLAHDKARTVSEARRLYREIGRPNLLIKVPATPEGILAVRELLAEGVSINITLMFSLKHYRDVAQAYIEGLEQYGRKGGDLSRLHSVASVFVSRIDTYVDKALGRLQAGTDDAEKQTFLENLKGKAAVANSKIIYQEYKKIFGSVRFKKLAAKKAHVQKVLWGSTSCKNPHYPDLIYVEPLVGPDTVNTMPDATLAAVMDHGRIRPNTIEENWQQCRDVYNQLMSLGIDLEQVGEILQKQGVNAFRDSFDSLMATLESVSEAKENAKKKPLLASLRLTQPDRAVHRSIQDEIGRLQTAEFHKRFLDKDPTLWKEEPAHRKVIENRLGWLEVHEWMLGKLYELDQLRAQVLSEKVKDVVLLGMGGSSLAPEVMSEICFYGRQAARRPRFQILDTTDPAAVAAVEKKLSLKSTWFIVASKSGSTVETLSQFAYFYDKAAKIYGKKAPLEKAGSHFLAITDEDSSLQSLAEAKRFRAVLINPSDIGGRYSALSLFGMVPAALMGLDVRALLRSARAFYEDFKAARSLKQNDAVGLGVALGMLAKHGKDKLTFLSSPALAPFEAWQEQLIAESTGKERKGIIPIQSESMDAAKHYGQDRVFVVQSLKGEKAAAVSRQGAALKKAGFAVVDVEWPDAMAIGGQFLLWEVLTAIASIALGVNPFDEPNVKESKDITNRILTQYEANGRLPHPAGPLKTRQDVAGFMAELKSGGFVALLAYTERTPQVARALGRIQDKIRRKYKVPVLTGFGPRYLHSIGQLYKGGPLKGLFLEFLKKDAKDLKIPGQEYRFGQLKLAQAMGDLEAMKSKGLPARVFLTGSRVVAGLRTFEKLI